MNTQSKMQLTAGVLAVTVLAMTPRAHAAAPLAGCPTFGGLSAVGSAGQPAVLDASVKGRPTVG